MPLSKAKGNMYSWCTHVHTHLAGACSHRCSYCYVQAMERWHKSGRYAGPLRLVEKELRVRYGTGKTIFVEHCNDLWAEDVPFEVIAAVLLHCIDWPENAYIFQSKNPIGFLPWVTNMPPNRLLGCTLETTDADTLAQLSAAPPPLDRVRAMRRLSAAGERVYVTVEPILDGNPVMLSEWIASIRPQFVNIGADSKGGQLPEPTAADVRELITRLRECGIEIRQKRNLGRLLNNEKGADQ